MTGQPFEPSQLREFRAELRDNPALVEHVLEELPPAPPEWDHVLIRCDGASVDLALARALALAIEGVEARIELGGSAHGE